MQPLIQIVILSLAATAVVACGGPSDTHESQWSEEVIAAAQRQYVPRSLLSFDEPDFGRRQHRRQTANRTAGDLTIDAFAYARKFNWFQEIVANPKRPLSPVRPVPIPERLSKQTVIRSLLPNFNPDNIKKMTTDLSNLKNRWFNATTGMQASDLVFARAQEIAQAAGNPDSISVRRVRLSNMMQYNVVAQIRGRTEKTMVLGAHLDATMNAVRRRFIPDPATNPGVPVTIDPEVTRVEGGLRTPGADDDACGVSTILEIFRVMSTSNQTFDTTWEFHFYAAEEIGLHGSAAVAFEWVQNQKRDVAAYLNLDLTGFVPPGSAPVIALLEDFADERVTRFAETVVREYLTIGTTRFQCGSTCSDHVSWFKNGVPTVFPYESAILNPHFHTPNDTPDKLNFTHAAELGRLAAAIMIELDGASGAANSTTSVAIPRGTAPATATSAAGAPPSARTTAVATAGAAPSRSSSNGVQDPNATIGMSADEKNAMMRAIVNGQMGPTGQTAQTAQTAQTSQRWFVPW
ncbi:Leucine aminopeptidase 1 [Quaeritorhiza haematococci]|nr:Leucine aminopeptidase 1 [Quaeritorhiza haematococci]